MPDFDDRDSASSDAPIPAAPARVMPTSMLSTGNEDLEAINRTLDLRTLAGAMPADLGGHLFIAGSIATPGRPAFSGEGTIYRFDLADGPKLKQAVFRPPCFMLDQALKDGDNSRLLEFYDLGLTRMSPLLGVRTVLSNSPIALHDRMIITTDAGRPWEFDPVTLELVTPIGKVDEWVSAIPAPWLFPLTLTSAHPVEDDKTGELFTVNYANAGAGNPGFTHLVRWHKRGALEHFKLIDDNGDPVVIEESVHQVALTRNHVILQDSAFVVEMRQLAFDAAELLLPGLHVGELFGSHQMRAQRATTVLYLIPRKQLRPRSGGVSDHPTTIRATRVEIPGESVHFFTQYDDDERLELIVPHTPTLDVSEWVHEGEVMLDGSRASEDIAGMQIPCALTQGFLAVHHIDPGSGRLLSARLTRCEETWGLALGTHAEGTQDRPLEYLFFNTGGFAPELVPQRVLKAYQSRVNEAMLPMATGKEPRLLSFEIATGEITSFLCPHGWGLMSPAFVPRLGGTGGGRDGYLVCLAHSAASVPRTPDSSGEEVWIFDAADIARGPICRLGHPQLDFALTVHSTWTAELRPSPRDYHVSVAEDLDLEFMTRRSFGQIAFWDIFSAAIGAAMKHDTVNELLRKEVLPHFDRDR